VDYEVFYYEKNMEFLKCLFEKLMKGPVVFNATSQQEYFSSYWPRLNTVLHSWIDWTMPLEMLDRFICAFDDHYSGAQTTKAGALFRLKKSMIDYNDGGFHPFQYGLVYRNNGKWISIAANGGTLIVQSVLGEAGEDLMASIKPGDRFFTPGDKLEQALSQRVFYAPNGIKGV
jgi:methionyl-tRNA formyltransferase